MTLSFPSLVHTWRAALPLVAVVLLSPGRATAECGDYVTIRNAPAGSVHHVPSDAPNAVPVAETPTPAKRPCHGPNCSGSPVREAPPMAPVAPAGPRAKELVRLLDFIHGPDTDPGSGFDRDTTSPRPVSRADAIFHPPRRG